MGSLTASAGRVAEETVITAAIPPIRSKLAEVWRFRELLYFLVWRNIKIRYSQTVIGAGWALLQPLLTALILSVVLGRMAKLPSDGTPHFIFYLTGLVPWLFFATAVSTASNSLVFNQSLLVKIYFPRLALPIAAVLSSLVDLGIGLGCLLIGLLLTGFGPSPLALLLLPVLLLPAIVAAAGLGFWLSALNLQYRDVSHIVPFMLQLMLYASPILYSAALVPEKYRIFYFANPMAGVIGSVRSVLLGTHEMAWSPILLAVGTATILFLIGIIYFERTERRFADFA